MCSSDWLLIDVGEVYLLEVVFYLALRYVFGEYDITTSWILLKFDDMLAQLRDGSTGCG